MKNTTTFRAAAAALAFGLTCAWPLYGQAQAFVNLDFEQARLPEVVTPPLFLTWEQAAPGWDHSEGDSTDHVYYLEGHLGYSQAYILRGEPGSFYMALHNGTLREHEPRGPLVNAFLSQRGVVPADAARLVLSASSLQFAVLIDGHPIEMRPSRPGIPGVDYDINRYGGDWTGDVSFAAGRLVELKIVNTARGDDSSNLLALDTVRFLPIPEPSPRALLLAGVVGLWLLVWRDRQRLPSATRRAKAGGVGLERVQGHAPWGSSPG